MGDVASRVFTFMFTDIEGSTRRWELYPTVMHAALAQHDAIVGAAVRAAGGQIVKTTGDGVHAVFDSPDQAIAAAVAAQRGIGAETWPTPGGLKIRVGIHTGEAMPRAGDFYGPTLNRAARLMSAGHGGQILLSGSAEAELLTPLPEGVSLRDLGERRLKDLVNLERIYQVDIDGLAHDFPPINSLDARPNNLPVQGTPLVGRDADLAALVDLLRQPSTRLVTLTGPGGTGKTRLACHAAAELIDEFAHGVYFIDLAPIRGPELVAPTIATTLGLTDLGGQSALNALRAHLRDKSMLLVLDNFEQVIGAATTVAALLAAAPKLRLVATSRIVLRLRDERELPIPPLALPADQPGATLADLVENPAVALFAQRARAVRPTFTLDAELAPVIAAICRRLDGLPLAIELAAARTRLLPPAALLARLDHRLAVLTSGPRDLPIRQQTLRSTIAWSYELLEPPLQTLFARLSVFAGGCDFESAEAVCAEPPIEVDLLDGLAELVEQSLIRQVETVEGEPRFTLLETIREYGLERLTEVGELAAVRQRHAERCLAFAESAEPHFWGRERQTWLKRVDREIDNLRAALTWATDEAAPAIGVLFGAALWYYWFATDRVDEGRQWLDVILRRVDGQTPRRLGEALNGAGALARRQDDYRAARRYHDQSIDLLRQQPDQRLIAGALNNLGVVIREQGFYRQALAVFADALTQYRALGAAAGVARALNELAITEHYLGDTAEAERHFGEALAIHQRQGTTWQAAMTLTNLGQALRERDNLAAAEPLLLEGLALRRKLDDPVALAHSLSALADLALARGHTAEARRLIDEALAIRRRQASRAGLAESHLHLGEIALAEGQADAAHGELLTSLRLFADLSYRPGAARCLEQLGRLAAAQGDFAAAAKLIGAADRLLADMGAGRSPFAAKRYQQMVATIRAELGDTVFLAMLGQGVALDLAGAVEQALTHATAPAPQPALAKIG